MTGSELALTLFAVCNSVRVLAYLPQIVRLVRDDSGAKAVSASTWCMFAVSHLSTVIYALAVLGDGHMALIFAVNTVACAVILAITVGKRRGRSGPAPRVNLPLAGPVRLAGPDGGQRATTLLPFDASSTARDLRAEYLRQMWGARLEWARRPFGSHAALPITP